MLMLMFFFIPDSLNHLNPASGQNLYEEVVK